MERDNSQLTLNKPKDNLARTSLLWGIAALGLGTLACAAAIWATILSAYGNSNKITLKELEAMHRSVEPWLDIVPWVGLMLGLGGISAAVTSLVKAAKAKTHGMKVAEGPVSGIIGLALGFVAGWGLLEILLSNVWGIQLFF